MGDSNSKEAALGLETEEETLTLIKQTLNAINVAEFEKVFQNNKIKYPSNVEKWIIPLIEHLNNKFIKIRNVQLIRKEKKKSIKIYSMLSDCPDSLKEFLIKAIKEVGSEIDQILETSLRTIARCTDEGITTYGWSLFIELISELFPNLNESNFGRWISILRRHKRHTNVIETLFWCFAQFGFRNFRFGYKVWMKVVVPRTYKVIHLKHYKMAYLTVMLKMAKKRNVKEELQLIQYDFLFHMTYLSSPELLEVLNLLFNILQKISVQSGKKQLLLNEITTFIHKYPKDNHLYTLIILYLVKIVYKNEAEIDYWYINERKFEESYVMLINTQDEDEDSNDEGGICVSAYSKYDQGKNKRPSFQLTFMEFALKLKEVERQKILGIQEYQMIILGRFYHQATSKPPLYSLHT